MYPVLFDFGPIALHTYGLAMALAFGLGTWVAMKRAERKGLGSKFALDAAVAILIFSMIGARFTYVITHWNEFADHPLDAISPIQHDGRIGIAGLVLLGGVAAAFLTAYIFSTKRKVSFLTATDLLIIPTALGIAIGRLGCFFNGCCFGLPAHVPWCVHFPKGSLAGDVMPGVCVHPTQLYESFWMAIVFAGLTWYDRHPLPKGRVTGLFLLLYGVGRWFNEQLRWYEHEMILLQGEGFRLTISQVISLVMVICGIVLIVRSLRKSMRLAT